LGVTPSAWQTANNRAIQVLGFGSLSSNNSQGTCDLAYNCYNTTAQATLGWRYTNSSASASLYQQLNGIHAWHIAPSGTAGDAISFTQAMTLDASGNLGVGTTSPAARLHGVSGAGADAAAFSDGANYTLAVRRLTSSTGGMITGTAGSALGFGTDNTERARITSGGDLLVGTTSSSAKFSLQYSGATIIGQDINDADDAANSTFVQFRVQGTQAGTIKRVASTSAVIYNTTSDYRLKTVTGSVTGHGARIDALKPIDYQWKQGNTPARGFLAHEFQEVYPSSVSGTKDAVDAEGNPIYQAMQASTSEVIADLVAELQSLRARVAALESI
jgi:hypothetical protein